MRRLALIVCMTLVGLLEVSSQRYYALVVGISDYRVDTLNLSNPKNDATRLYKVLTRDKHYAGSTSKFINRYATKANILKELKEISRIANEKDRIVFSFAGHGGNGWLLTADRQELSYKELLDVLKESSAKHVYCLIDACHSGSVRKQFLRRDKELTDSGINFVIACREDELAKESRWINNGYFSKALIKGLKGLADTNDDGMVTLWELYNYAHKDVTTRVRNETEEGSQTPQLVASKELLNTVIFHCDNKRKLHY